MTTHLSPRPPRISYPHKPIGGFALRKFLGAGLIILFILVFLVFNFFQKEVKNVFYLISSPVQGPLWRAGESVFGFFETIRELKELKIKKEELELKNQKLLAEIVELKELKKENETLRQALEIGLEKEFKLVFAGVINKAPFEDSILLNKGSKDGVLEGMPVITQEKALLGKISEVYENFSRLMLISNKKSSFSARIQDKEILGVIEGKERFLLSFNRIPQNKEVVEGALVISDVLSGDFPGGLLVGKIVKIQKSAAEPFQEIEVSPFFNLRKTDRCFIITQ